MPVLFRLVLLLLLLLPTGALAVNPDEEMADPVLEKRARVISAELRCLVCQNENIDASNADLARDLRILVRDRLAAGDSNSEVLDYVVSRYGEFVLLRPRFNGSTLLLWGAPMLLLLGGVGLIIVRRREKPLESRPLDAEEETALERVLGNKK